jgi:hypothetical protein
MCFMTSNTSARVQTWNKSRLRPVVEQCLSRDPADRPTAQGVIGAIHRLCSTTSTADMDGIRAAAAATQSFRPGSAPAR